MIWLLCLLIGIAIIVFILDMIKKTKVEEDTETEEKEIDSSANTTKECVGEGDISAFERMQGYQFHGKY